MKRPHLLAMLAGAGTAALVRPLAAQTPATVRISSFASESTGGAFYAQDEGFFTRHGIAAQIATGTGGAAIGAAMIAGDVDIGESDIITIAIAHDKGVPFVFIAPGELHSIKTPTLGMAVHDPALKLGKDFDGKTLACNVSRGFGTLLADAWIDNKGGDSKTIKWIEFPFPALAAALERGTIDGFIAPEPFLSQAMSSGGHLILMDKNPVTPVLLQGGWFATKDWVAKNTATAKAFYDAIRDADEWANHNEKATAEIISKYSHVPLPVIEGMVMRGQYQLQFDVRTMQPVIDAAAKYGLISKPFRASEMLAQLG